MSLVVSLFSVLALMAQATDVGSAATPQMTQPVTTAAAAPSPGDDAIVCKSVAITGTRFPTRTCHTKREWIDMTAAARDFTNKLTSGPCSGMGCKGGGG